MTDKSKHTPERSWPCATDEKKINFQDFWRVIRKRRKIIGYIMAVIVSATIIVSLFLTDIYQAKAVIIPVANRDSTSSGAGLGVLAQQFGGLAGFSTSLSAAASEIVTLLNSNILREEMIEQYNLLPVLFSDKWDTKRQNWKQGYSFRGLNSFSSASSIPATGGKNNDPAAPGTWDALRLLDKIMKISRNSRDNTIIISVDFRDPELAARITDYYLATLTNHMSSEAKRVATINRKYLEEQLSNTADPFIKQKTYNMIAQQIETGMMAEVKENFAFKVIDPPLAPDRSIKPQRAMIILLSLAISLIAAICAAFALEYLEKIQMKNREVKQ